MQIKEFTHNNTTLANHQAEETQETVRPEADPPIELRWRQNTPSLEAPTRERLFQPRSFTMKETELIVLH